MLTDAFAELQRVVALGAASPKPAADQLPCQDGGDGGTLLWGSAGGRVAVGGGCALLVLFGGWLLVLFGGGFWFFFGGWLHPGSALGHKADPFGASGLRTAGGVPRRCPQQQHTIPHLTDTVKEGGFNYHS